MADIKTTKKLAALRQIKAAIELLHKDELECAMTLAAAAEGCLPATDEPHLFRDLRARDDAKDLDLNLIINWLKHDNETDPEEGVISEFEATVTIARAITKFIANYHQTNNRMEEFLAWGHERGHLPNLGPPQNA